MIYPSEAQQIRINTHTHVSGEVLIAAPIAVPQHNAAPVHGVLAITRCPELLLLWPAVAGVGVKDDGVGADACCQGLEGCPERAVCLGVGSLEADDGGDAVERCCDGEEGEREEEYHVELSARGC